MSEASEPGVKPVPFNVMVSPPARPLQTGMEGFELSHVAPGAVVVSVSVVTVAAPLTSTTLIVTKAPPAVTAATPRVDSSVISREPLDRGEPSAAMGRPLSRLPPVCPPRERTPEGASLHSLLLAGGRFNSPGATPWSHGRIPLTSHRV